MTDKKTEIPAKYDPTQAEDRWYADWMAKGYFHSEPDTRKPFTVVIPPPNVTGVLHMGHMLNNTIQDVLVRRARLCGYNACWVPGTDHASIATEAKVVQFLASQGISKKDLTREQFLAHAWKWKEKHGGIILQQLRKLGASCDWERTKFTMDESLSQSVIKVFVQLYNEGKIYRGIRMVNWDPKALTALSDEEVIYKEHEGKLYYLRYMVEGEAGQYAVVATTRPETIFGDTAMCINPNDPKNAHLRGKRVIVPICGRSIPVIEDEYVDIEFGTGCLKVTPAHDINDYMLGEKYNLPSIDIFNDNGTLNENGMTYAGMDRFDVREKIEKDLQDAGLLEKTESYVNQIGTSERTGVPIEPKLSMQWFLKMEELSQPALKAVMEDIIKLYPSKFKNTYRHWMENVRDWCVSRQLWWGQRIPAYYLPEGGFVVAETAEKALELAREKNPSLNAEDLKQDPDVLDTWFSSWLWPISVFDGINNPGNNDIEYYYPTNDLVTGPDILFFWVARMIIAGYKFKGDRPFSNVYLTGIVRDNLRRKMSKQLGNSPDPLDLIAQYGADSVRVALMLCTTAGNDIIWDQSLIEQGRNFGNKIWNTFRLLDMWQVEDKEQPNSSTVAVEWFGSLLSKTVSEIDRCFAEYRISDAMMTLYRLFWDDFSASYLEIIKPPYGEAIDKKTYDKTIEFYETLLKHLHPYMPFITEEIWHYIRPRGERESIMVSRYDKPGNVDLKCLEHMGYALDVVSAIRNIRAGKNIAQKEALTVKVIKDENYPEKEKEVICKLANVQIEETETKPELAESFIVKTTEYFVILDGKIDLTAQREKLEKDLDYTEKFLQGVMKKLSNERFVNSAPKEVVDKERMKQTDAEKKIKVLKEQIAAFS